MFKDHLIFSNNIYDAAKQILEAQQIQEKNIQGKNKMNYLTSYYKNLSEQLQEKVNYLEKVILETKRNTEKVIIHAAEREEGEDTPTLHGTIASGKGAKRGTEVNIEPGYAIRGVKKQTEIHDAEELASGDADKNNIYTTGKAIKVNKSQMRRA